MKEIIVIWLLCITVVESEVCTFTQTNSSVARECDFGCCGEIPDQQCCSEPFWTWYTIIWVSVTVVVGLLIVGALAVLMCVYCGKHKAHTTELRRTRSLQSNRVQPFASAPPPYGAAIQPPPAYSYVPPPPYEAIQLQPLGVPQPKPSRNMPKVSRGSAQVPRQ